MIIAEFTIIASNEKLTSWVGYFISRSKDGIYCVDFGELWTERVKILRDLKAGRMADRLDVIEIEF